MFVNFVVSGVQLVDSTGFDYCILVRSVIIILFFSSCSRQLTLFRVPSNQSRTGRTLSRNGKNYENYSGQEAADDAPTC